MISNTRNYHIWIKFNPLSIGLLQCVKNFIIFIFIVFYCFFIFNCIIMSKQNFENNISHLSHAFENDNCSMTYALQMFLWTHFEYVVVCPSSECKSANLIKLIRHGISQEYVKTWRQFLHLLLLLEHKCLPLSTVHRPAFFSITPLLTLLRFHAATSTQTQTIQYCKIKLKKKKKIKGCVKNTVLCIVHLQTQVSSLFFGHFNFFLTCLNFYIGLELELEWMICFYLFFMGEF